MPLSALFGRRSHDAVPLSPQHDHTGDNRDND
jgi:hypothetical protein